MHPATSAGPIRWLSPCSSSVRSCRRGGSPRAGPLLVKVTIALVTSKRSTENPTARARSSSSSRASRSVVTLRSLQRTTGRRSVPPARACCTEDHKSARVERTSTVPTRTPFSSLALWPMVTPRITTPEPQSCSWLTRTLSPVAALKYMDRSSARFPQAVTDPTAAKAA